MREVEGDTRAARGPTAESTLAGVISFNAPTASRGLLRGSERSAVTLMVG
jgi:hypothetical protein